MTVRTALNALGTRLGTITSPKPKRIYTDPAEAVSLADFPCIVLGLSPQDDHQQMKKAVQLKAHRYVLAIWVFVGSRQTKLPELHSRVLDWPDAIGDCLAQSMTLGNAVDFVGDTGAPTGLLWRYRIGSISWGDGEYFGVTGSLPVTEIKQVLFQR